MKHILPCFLLFISIISNCFAQVDIFLPQGQEETYAVCPSAVLREDGTFVMAVTFGRIVVPQWRNSFETLSVITYDSGSLIPRRRNIITAAAPPGLFEVCHNDITVWNLPGVYPETRVPPVSVVATTNWRDSLSSPVRSTVSLFLLWNGVSQWLGWIRPVESPTTPMAQPALVPMQDGMHVFWYEGGEVWTTVVGIPDADIGRDRNAATKVHNPDNEKFLETVAKIDDTTLIAIWTNGGFQEGWSVYTSVDGGITWSFCRTVGEEIPGLKRSPSFLRDSSGMYLHGIFYEHSPTPPDTELHSGEAVRYWIRMLDDGDPSVYNLLPRSLFQW